MLHPVLLVFPADYQSSDYVEVLPDAVWLKNIWRNQRMMTSYLDWWGWLLVSVLLISPRLRLILWVSFRRLKEKKLGLKMSEKLLKAKEALWETIRKSADVFIRTILYKTCSSVVNRRALSRNHSKGFTTLHTAHSWFHVVRRHNITFIQTTGRPTCWTHLRPGASDRNREKPRGCALQNTINDDPYLWKRRTKKLFCINWLYLLQKLSCSK